MSTDILQRGLVLPHERRITGGRGLDGGIWLQVDGQGRVNIPPHEAFKLASQILQTIGVNVEFGYDGLKPS